jgi:ABC-type branched-subunit amino acid transport system ATPase component
LVEQNLPVANRLAKRAIVLDQGRVGYRGTVAELMNDPNLARTHLGLARAHA